MTVDSFLTVQCLPSKKRKSRGFLQARKQFKSSFNSKMHTGQKSELITCVEVNPTLEHPSVDAVVLDGTAIVNMLSLTEKVLDL